MQSKEVVRRRALLPEDRAWWDALLARQPDDAARIEHLIDMYELCSRQRDRAERQKAAPERQEFETLYKKWEDAVRRLHSTEADRDSWKRIAEGFAEENGQLKANTRIPWLEGEVERWKDKWTHLQKRMQGLAEHHFNGVLHEENLNNLERSNRALRERLAQYEASHEKP